MTSHPIHPAEPTIRCLRIGVDGSVEFVPIRYSTEGGIHDMRQAIGGNCLYYEAVPIGSGPEPDMYVWFDEEGMLNDSPVNYAIMMVLSRLVGPLRQMLYGNAVVSGGADDAGEMLPINQDDVDKIMGILEAFDHAP